MAQREALMNKLSQADAFVQQMRKVVKIIPKGNEPFTISAGCDAISLISDMKLLKQIEDSKDQEREIDKARSIGQGVSRGRSH